MSDFYALKEGVPGEKRQEGNIFPLDGWDGRRPSGQALQDTLELNLRLSWREWQAGLVLEAAYRGQERLDIYGLLFQAGGKEIIVYNKQRGSYLTVLGKGLITEYTPFLLSGEELAELCGQERWEVFLLGFNGSAHGFVPAYVTARWKVFQQFWVLPLKEKILLPHRAGLDRAALFALGGQQESVNRGAALDWAALANILREGETSLEQAALLLGAPYSWEEQEAGRESWLYLQETTDYTFFRERRYGRLLRLFFRDRLLERYILEYKGDK